jgi:DNA-binding MarR family transcriptional regulator
MPPRRTSEELLCLFQENWPEGYSPSEEVMLRLYHSALRHTEAMQRFLTQFDLSFAEFVLLRVLRRESPPHIMTPTALYETLVMSPGGITKVLKQLEAKALITRKTDARDKRRSLVELTTEGEAIATQVQQAVREFDTLLLDRTLNMREQAQLARLLRKLLISLEPARSAAAQAATSENLRMSAEG